MPVWSYHSEMVQICCDSIHYAVQVLPVVLYIRLYSARLEFFRSLAEGLQAPQVQLQACNLSTLPDSTTKALSAALQSMIMSATVCEEGL